MEYHIQLKEDYKPGQHPLCQVVVSLKPAYRTEFDRLMKLDIITEIGEDNEWVNSVVSVKKPDGSLRLYLDPNDLKNMKQNQ